MSARGEAKQDQRIRRRRLPPVKRLRELLEYDEAEGRLRWRTGLRRGSIAGSLDSRGYRRIRIDKANYAAARVVWKLVHRVEPPVIVDHQNRSRDDNRIENLRGVTFSESVWNTKISVRNTSGVIGVCWKWDERYSVGGYYRAYLSVDGRQMGLGCFPTVAAAAAARRAAEVRYFGGDPHALPSEVGASTGKQLELFEEAV